MKIWKKHHVSEDKVFEVFENLEAPVQIRRIGKAYLAMEGLLQDAISLSLCMSGREERSSLRQQET